VSSIPLNNTLEAFQDFSNQEASNSNTAGDNFVADEQSTAEVSTRLVSTPLEFTLESSGINGIEDSSNKFQNISSTANAATAKGLRRAPIAVVVEKSETKVYDSIEKSREIVNSARKQAAYILSNAEQEAKRHLIEQRQLGYESGRAEAIEHFWKLFRTEQQIEADLTKRAQNAVCELTLKIAQQVVATAIAEQPESILARVKRAMIKLNALEHVTIFAHPSQLAVLETAVSSGALGYSIKIAADASLNPSDARLEYSNFQILASASEHLAAIEKHLNQYFNEKQS